MYQTKLNYSQALEKEALGEITIIDLSPKSVLTTNQRWRDNLQVLQERYPNMSIAKAIDFLQAKYIIEKKERVSGESNTYSWSYFHGVENRVKGNIPVEGIEYVYLLTNPGYPDLVKVGMTIHSVEGRVVSINATSTVHEWVPKFALPVSKGTALKVEQSVHRALEHCRVTSDQGSIREFFRIDPIEALDKIREVGERFKTGKVIMY
jgi:hypothetical protein